MEKVLLCIVALPLAMLVQAAPSGACSTGPECGAVEYAGPNALQFIADAHNAGIPGSAITSVQVGAVTLSVTNKYKNLNQADANIYGSSALLCFGVWGRASEINWPMVNQYLGVQPSPTQLNALYASLQSNNLCG